MNLIINELAKKLPKVSKEQFETIKSNIDALEHRPLIKLYKGQVLIGYHEYEYCSDNNIEFDTEELKISSDIEAFNLVMLEYFRRLHFSKAQSACYIVEQERLVSEILEENKSRKSQKLSKQYSFLNSNQEKLSSLTLRDQLALIADCSATYIQQAMLLKKDSPELFQKVKSGIISSLPKAKKILEKGEPKTKKTSPKVKAANVFGKFIEDQKIDQKSKISIIVNNLNESQKVELLKALAANEESKPSAPKLKRERKSKPVKADEKEAQETSDLLF